MRFVDSIVALHDALTSHGIPHAFGGALALIQYVEPRATAGIDVNVFVERPEVAPVLEALESLGCEVPPAAEWTDAPPVAGIRCGWEWTHVDVFPSDGSPFSASVEQRVVVRPFEDSEGALHDLPFLSPEDIAIFKVLFDRPKDWVDVEQLARYRDLDLGLGLMERWITHLRGDRAARSTTRLRTVIDRHRGALPGGSQ